MPRWFSDSILIRVAVVGFVCLAATSAVGQTPTYRAPRTAGGKPDLNGIWQGLNSANWDLQGHAAGAGPVPSLGPVFATPPAPAAADADEIRSLPQAAATREP